MVKTMVEKCERGNSTKVFVMDKDLRDLLKYRRIIHEINLEDKVGVCGD